MKKNEVTYFCDVCKNPISLGVDFPGELHRIQDLHTTKLCLNAVTSDRHFCLSCFINIVQSPVETDKIAKDSQNMFTEMSTEALGFRNASWWGVTEVLYKKKCICARPKSDKSTGYSSIFVFPSVQSDAPDMILRVIRWDAISKPEEHLWTIICESSKEFDDIEAGLQKGSTGRLHELCKRYDRGISAYAAIVLE